MTVEAKVSTNQNITLCMLDVGSLRVKLKNNRHISHTVNNKNVFMILIV
jgi:hypothetical protein